MPKYYAINGVDSDSYGMNFNTYTWRGAVHIQGTTFKCVKLEDHEAFYAYALAQDSPLLDPRQVVLIETEQFAAPQLTGAPEDLADEDEAYGQKHPMPSDPQRLRQGASVIYKKEQESKSTDQLKANMKGPPVIGEARPKLVPSGSDVQVDAESPAKRGREVAGLPATKSPVTVKAFPGAPEGEPRRLKEPGKAGSALTFSNLPPATKEFLRPLLLAVKSKIQAIVGEQSDFVFNIDRYRNVGLLEVMPTMKSGPITAGLIRIFGFDPQSREFAGRAASGLEEPVTDFPIAIIGTRDDRLSRPLRVPFDDPGEDKQNIVRIVKAIAQRVDLARSSGSREATPGERRVIANLRDNPLLDEDGNTWYARSPVGKGGGMLVRINRKEGQFIVTSPVLERSGGYEPVAIDSNSERAVDDMDSVIRQTYNDAIQIIRKQRGIREWLEIDELSMLID